MASVPIWFMAHDKLAHTKMKSYGPVLGKKFNKLAELCGPIMRSTGPSACHMSLSKTLLRGSVFLINSTWTNYHSYISIISGFCSKVTMANAKMLAVVSCPVIIVNKQYTLLYIIMYTCNIKSQKVIH